MWSIIVNIEIEILNSNTNKCNIANVRLKINIWTYCRAKCWFHEII